MKSWKNLFQIVVSPQNMREAVRLASRDKGDMPAVRRAMRDPDLFAQNMAKRVESGSWMPPKHIRHVINDGIKKKQRCIVKPTFEEQVVHHAAMLAMEPVFMRGMYEYSCGSIPGRGASYGKRYIERWIRRNPKRCRYVLKMDVRHFFQSIDQGILMAKLSRIVADDRMLELLRLIVTCENDPETGKGIPIGFYTSQWLSNFYLQDLDHFIKEHLKAPCYVRYMDDMVIIGPSKRKLHRMRREIGDYLATIGLEMKADWQVFKFEYEGRDGRTHGRPIDFMGFVFHRDRTVLRRSIFFRAVRKARRMRNGRTNWYNACQMLSYCGYLRQADCHGAFESCVAPFVCPRRLKAIVSEHDRRMPYGNGVCA